ncbi:Olfactory receptor 6C65 [Microtus ochrogaster]|uniref:Olfactory receptor 6C65 n=1 Tax=Microtus ochrogaster TaxID=79684 RepID=A0A8J6KK50_MICOH|nr:Olfactory receptor 6C65 [Microtus ochrogaster]
MSYDRYVAICKPLHYMTIMNNKICMQLVLSCWIAGFFVIFPPLLVGLNVDFCASNIVDHFYCDTTPLMQISCTDTQLMETMGFVSALVTLFLTLLLVIISYTYIAITILKIPSTSQRKKAFSTCSSHMIVISLSYGSCIFICCSHSNQQNWPDPRRLFRFQPLLPAVAGSVLTGGGRWLAALSNFPVYFKSDWCGHTDVVLL